MNNKQPTPHPHADLICKWANEGVRIQKYMSTVEDWRDDANPQWLPQCKYRIKPEDDEPWKPKEGEKFFYLDKVLVINSDNYNEYKHTPLLLRGNCFRTSKEAEAAVPRVEKALKNLYTISDKKAHDLECELYDKIDRLTKYPELGGKPMTSGEKALIRAFRNGRLCRQFSNGSSLIVEGHDKVPKGVTTHREFVAFFMYSPMQDGEVRNALEIIKAEQENALETIEAEQEVQNEA